MNDREIQIVQLASALYQANEALDQASDLFATVYPTNLAFVKVDLREIQTYLQQAIRAIRHEVDCQEQQPALTERFR